MKKRIPYAVASYEEIVEEGYYFVDKTRFVRELEQYKLPVFLRPRRFGKSLWCSILECYYDINRRDRFEALFANTDIGREPTSDRNSHLILRFDFSKILVRSNLGELEDAFNEVCLNSYLAFHHFYKNYLPDLEKPVPGSASGNLSKILEAVRLSGSPPVHIIIDEYDNFTNQLLTARQDHVYRDLTTGDSFLRTFYKIIKAGVGERTIARAFVTGVLPVTMDDLTSGFNIGQIITLKEHTLEMMGFTQSEVEAYVGEIAADYALDDNLRKKVLDDLRIHYNGYRLLPDASNTLYNSTICNFYLNDLVIDNGRRIPRETIDQNLRTDTSWLHRLTGSARETRDLLEQLMFDGTLPVDLNMLSSKFSMERFFEKSFFSLSLYYLGMVTFRDRFTLEFPNLTVKTIFTQYFNEVERIEVSLGYTDMFRQFLADRDWAALFAGYWQQYIGQIPAQTFDKINENFFRTTFYELCTRYLSYDFRFAIEVNRRSGRSDWEAVGRAGTQFENQAAVIEFKHVPLQKGGSLGVLDWDEPRQDDVEQITRYAGELKRDYPELTVRCHIVYTVDAKNFRFFSL